ncbi:MAG TPA: hypothetical protein VFO19_05590 [Vicinamibacterales bacterium]|nr:hypothetical protein [Vicinamibacterales bacterium]
MFAGIPGIGVGTLFYVLTALWMPFREIGFVLRGQSSWRRWALIGMELCFAIGIMASIAIADRLLMWWLTESSTPSSVGPARWIHQQMGGYAAGSYFAAPIFASLLLLAGVLLAVEIARLLIGRRRAERPVPEPAPAAAQRDAA